MKKFNLFAIVSILVSLQVAGQDPTTPTPQWKPQYHFSPPKYWTNDPNGLIFLDGKFNLYYQHNPFENKWGHMSWGHATSTDLVHWKDLPVAIPEIVTPDTTTWIYSGSAVLDKNNTSGFGLGGKAPVVAIFTADQPKQKKESQFIAYSNDGGLHYTQYAGNPVIDLNMHDFRDPNVFWYEPAKRWIMTVAMVDQHQVRLYASKDLKHWDKLSDFGPAGYTKNGWECPSLLPLIVDNDPSKTKWVLFVSCGGDHGPLMQYYVGDFDGTTFTNSNPADQTLVLDHGSCFYAAIAWRDAPGNRKILLGWLQNGNKETYPWKGQMSIPRDLSLKTTPDGLRLIQPPTSLIAGKLAAFSKGRATEKSSVRPGIAGANWSAAVQTAANAWWLDAQIAVGASDSICFEVAASADASRKIRVGYDAAKQELCIEGMRAPLRTVNGAVRLQILLDRSSLEVFGNGGEAAISTMVYPEAGDNGLRVNASAGALIRSCTIWNLN